MEAWWGGSAPLVGVFTWLVACGFAAPAFAGHTLAHYPSYYPDEIRIEVIDPTAAAKGLADETLHAYVGGNPAFTGPVPGHVRSVESLGSFLILEFNPASLALASEAARCAAARDVLAALSRVDVAGFVYHPYPVTPYHADYLHHLDRVRAAKDTVRLQAASAPGATVSAKGRLAQAIVAALGPRAATADADATLLEVPVEALSAAELAPFDGWVGRPWVKAGWFQTHGLLAPAADPARRGLGDELLRRLLRGDVHDPAEHANAERDLLSALADGCQRVVAGFAPRREFVNGAFSAGIENVAFDPQLGLNAPVFIRTAKLKDYPWNGSLRLGVPARSEAAWNPVAGFGDPVGRLIWSAIGDPAMIQAAFDAHWTANRVQPAPTMTHGQSGGLKVPDEALRPRPGSGMLDRVGARAFASARVVYEVLASPFLDGSETEMADLIYPFAFAYRWGAAADLGGEAREPALAATMDVLRDRLVGLLPLRVNRTAFNIAEGFDLLQKTPMLEVYLRDAPGGEDQAAALAPPWSTVPWHLLALMEAAVTRGYAAFSLRESLRRGVPWLDLARDAPLRAKLMSLCAEFEQSGFRPAALADWVADEDARGRWRALRSFAERHGHFLVTNGPYRLESWTADSAVLSAVREATYPLGFGTFDPYVDPPRAVIRQVTREAGAIVVRADADVTVKVERRTEVRREKLTRSTAHGTRGVQVDARYLLIGPDDAVVRAGRMSWERDDRFKIELPARLAPGRHAVLIAIYLDGNALAPSAEVFEFEASGKD